MAMEKAEFINVIFLKLWHFFFIDQLDKLHNANGSRFNVFSTKPVSYVALFLPRLLCFVLKVASFSKNELYLNHTISRLVNLFCYKRQKFGIFLT